MFVEQSLWNPIFRVCLSCRLLTAVDIELFIFLWATVWRQQLRNNTRWKLIAIVLKQRESSGKSNENRETFVFGLKGFSTYAKFDMIEKTKIKVIEQL